MLVLASPLLSQATPAELLAAVLAIVACSLVLLLAQRRRQARAPCGAIPTVRARAFDSAQYRARTHDYITELHAALRARTFFAEIPSGTGAGTGAGAGAQPPALFTCDPTVCGAVLAQTKLFAPARCPASAFSASPGRAGLAARSSFDLVQPMARGTIFDLGGAEWQRQRRCLAPLFAVRGEHVPLFAAATERVLDRWFGASDSEGGWRPAVDAQLLAYEVFVAGTLLLMFGPALPQPPAQWRRLRQSLYFFQQRFAGAGEGGGGGGDGEGGDGEGGGEGGGNDDGDAHDASRLGAADHEVYASTIHAVCADAVRWGLVHPELCSERGGFRRLAALGGGAGGGGGAGAGGGVGEAALTATVANFVVAAAESPASALAHALAQLAAMPGSSGAALAARVRAELRAAGGARALSKEAVTRRMPLTAAVLREAMRHKAPATMVVREAIVDTSLELPAAATGGRGRGGAVLLELPAGTEVRMCLHAMHHDGARWGNPAEFQPARFLSAAAAAAGGGGVGGTNRSSSSSSSIPFSMGKRGCPGEALSMVWMCVALALLLERLDVRAPAGSEGGGARNAHTGNHVRKFVSWAPRGIRLEFRPRLEVCIARPEIDKI